MAYRINDSERKIEWAKNNKEKVIKANILWVKNNPEKAKKYRKTTTQNAILNMPDYYIKKLLIKQGAIPEQITPELIELKRITLKTTRLCRQLKN